MKYLRGYSIESSLYDFKNIVSNVPTLRAQYLLPKTVNDALYRRGVGVDGSKAIFLNLYTYLSKHDSMKNSNASPN
eukprot:snap_masked-scaffold_1-processed-gene-14.35-mRNA-1 protein AED:1.00 eAED:1.00 QI:0/-1/0/0/-1/1/1/0/75